MEYLENGGKLRNKMTIMKKGNLKLEFIKAMKKNKVNINKWKFKYYKKSPYQSRRYKQEHIDQELWVYPRGTGRGELVMGEQWMNKEYRKTLIETFVEEAKMRGNN